MKLSTKTLMEEVQLEVLETRVRVSGSTTCKCKLWNTQPINIALRATKLIGSQFKVFQNSKLIDWPLHEEMQPVALEKNHFYYKEASYLYIPFGNSGLSKISTKEWKEKIWILNHLVRKPNFDWDLDRRNHGGCYEGNRV